MKYPIYIPSKGRCDNALTAPMLEKFGIPFYLVVEDREYQMYANRFGTKNVLNLGGNDYGDVAFARNFIINHALKNGHEFHWQMDDDIAGVMSVRGKQTLTENARTVLSSVEQFVDQYVNVAMAGLGSSVFGRLASKPYAFNKFAYTCFLLKSETRCHFTRGVEEDLDFNLQLLTNEWCTVQFNQYLFKWATTGTRKGGYTELNANNRRIERQKNTIKRWPQYLKELAPKKDGYRIVTNQVWKHFVHKPVRGGQK